MSPVLREIQESIMPAAKVFEDLENQHHVRFVLIGGAAVPLFVDPSAMTSYRKTKDIDVVVAAPNYQRFQGIENLLRQRGLSNDLEVGASPMEERLLFRWWLGPLCIDILSNNDVKFGNDVRWLGDDLEHSFGYYLYDGTKIWLAEPAAFVATKIDAFLERGKTDFLQSRDLEDVLTVIEGRKRFLEELELCAPETREFLRTNFQTFLRNQEFAAAIEGQFPSDRSRSQKLFERLTEIAKTP